LQEHLQRALQLHVHSHAHWRTHVCPSAPLQNFKSIKSRGAIQQQMMNKLVDILEQFLREIIAAQEMFDRSKANPPLTRNQPPVAGAQSGVSYAALC
jgi:hypothetical protein